MGDKEDIPNSQNLTSAGRDEIMQGAFGFNFQTVKSFWTLCRRPSEYFKAAKTADWMQKYTPALTLVVAISALTIAFEFLWAKPNGSFADSMNRFFIQDFEKRFPNVDASSLDLKEAVSKSMSLSNVIYTPIYIVLLSIFAWIYRAWGEKLPFVIRLRYVFAVIIPAGLFGLVFLLATSFVRGPAYDTLSYIQIPIILFIIFLTCLKGPFHHMDKGEAIGRSLFLTFSITICVFLAQVIAVFYAFWQILFPEMFAATNALLGK